MPDENGYFFRCGSGKGDGKDFDPHEYRRLVNYLLTLGEDSTDVVVLLQRGAPIHTLSVLDAINCLGNMWEGASAVQTFLAYNVVAYRGSAKRRWPGWLS